MRYWVLILILIVVVGCTNTPAATSPPVETVVTTIPPTPPTDMHVISSDSFDSIINGWSTGTKDNEYGTDKRDISNGKYRWEVKSKKSHSSRINSPADTVTDFFLTVDAQLESGPTNSRYGVFFRRDDDGNHYRISANDRQQFLVSMWYNGDWITLISWTETQAIKPGEVNKIGVLAEGSHFTFFINDQFVGEVEDDRIAAGNVGLIIYVGEGAENVFNFDNFEISTSNPPPTTAPPPTPPTETVEISSESFDSNEHGWPTGDRDWGERGNYEWSLSNGKYVWDINAKEYMHIIALAKVGQVGDFYLTVDTQSENGSSDGRYGVYFRRSTNPTETENSVTANYYIFRINNNQQFSLRLLKKSKWEYYIIPWTETSIIRPGEVNKIGVLAEGSHFTFFINDQYVGEAEDDTLSEGDIGLSVMLDGEQNVFKFDNFKLSTATSDQLIFLSLPDLPIGYVNKPYFYSFCKPDLKLKSDLCGAFNDTTDPIRGEPPYTFQLDTMGGFPPFGISLNLNGILSGTPTALGEKEFTVCAIDQTKAQVCRKKSLEVVEQEYTLTVIKKEHGGGEGMVYSYIGGHINCGNDCSDTYKKGTEVTLTGYALAGSTFSGWSGGECYGTGKKCTIVMDSDKTVNAIFEEREYSTPSTEAPTTTTAPSTTTPPQSEEGCSVTIDSASCVVRERVYGNPASFTVSSSGSASGPVGCSLNMPSFQDLGSDCGAWGSDCERDVEDPESTSWNAQGNGYFGMQTTLQASACLAVCAYDSAPVTCPTS